MSQANRNASTSTNILARSPRSRVPTAVFKKKALKLSSATGETLYDQMWAATTQYQQAALASDFVQGIAHSDLNPDQYGQFTVLDAAYCSYSANDYSIVIPKATDPEVKAFCEARQKDYLDYNAEVFAGWHISDPKAVQLTDLAQAYADFERTIADTMDPLYFVVAMTPCISLWTYIGLTLAPDATPNNLYATWIEANQVAEAPKDMADFINAHADQMEHRRAIEIFIKGMQFECNMFRSACGQPPI